MLPNGLNTYAGIIVTVLPAILSLFGIHIVQQDQFNALVMDGISLLGALYAFYGRARATTPGIFAPTAPAIGTQPSPTPTAPII